MMMERKVVKEKVVERKSERKEEKEREKVRKEKEKEKVEKAKERSTEHMTPMAGATTKKIMDNMRITRIGTKKSGVKSQTLNTLTCSMNHLSRSIASSGSPLEDDGARSRERELLLTRVCRPSMACLGSS